MLIHLNRTELVKAYRRALGSRYHLLAKWRFELLRAYTRRWDRYDLERKEYEQRRNRYMRRVLPLILLGLAAVCFTGLWLAWNGNCFWVLFTLGSIFGAVAAPGYWLAFPGKPVPPEKPLQQSKRRGYTSPVKSKLFPDVVPGWWQGLEKPILTYGEAEQEASRTQKWGLIGEYAFLRELALYSGPNTILLHSVMPKRKDDLDVVAIGPRGLWYFEIKYFNARIEWQDGIWTIWQYDHDSRSERSVDMLEYPDAQWMRMCRETLAILDSKARIITEIKGGIVFAHPDARLDIRGPTPFRYGTLPQWMKAYREAPRLNGMNPETILYFTETLLKRHQDLNSGLELFSMDYYLSDVIGRAEQQIRKWIQDSESANL